MIPTLLNGKEDFKVRFAFALVFLTVITNCTTNVIVFLYQNYSLIPLVFLLFFIPLLFGPAVLYYVKGLVGKHVNKSIILSLIPGIISFGYGIILLFSSDAAKQETLRTIEIGNHHFFNITNLITLFYILFYCGKSWFFLQKQTLDPSYNFYQQMKLKIAWAKEFVLYIFGHVFLFFLIHTAAVTKLIPITTLDLELVWMPVFMLLVYLIIAIRSAMMYKEFEHEFVLAKIEGDRKIQEQRMEIARDLHDSLGAQLTLISTMTDRIKKHVNGLDSEIIQNIDKLNYFSEKSIAELKNALWVLNSNQLTLNDFRNQLSNFFQKLEESSLNKEIFYEFNIQENLILQSKQAANLFRIIQECVNNSIKYALNDKIWVIINQNGTILNIEMEDNGIGFDPDKIKPDSYGIANLRHRVQSMDGTLELKTAINKGTCYKIIININQ